MSDKPTRRTVLKALGGTVGVGALGLGIFVKSTEPIVGDHSANSELLGETEFTVRVFNRGAKGHVLVSLEAIESPTVVLEKVTEEIHMSRSERRNVTLSMKVPEEASDVRVTTTALDFPGNILN